MALSKTILAILLIFVLGFSCCIIGSNAVPVTRTKSLMQENLPRFQASMNSHLDIVEAMQERTFMEQRKLADVQLEDYPGSGANNRHTPARP
ncbi:hypothetical protein SOVF_046290 [Spinacia oleracea]|uniref:Transmembrane protein n=1 Tax=Spinacia oleracea TaxID=3562 RepID=A0A9R0K5U7_SPIOL|nr:uncharacterized protein LOC110798719 [Spinacia oleracea]KNA21107.1 hypothetical protein SOVF_046290 [Spinacia oleracea]